MDRAWSGSDPQYPLADGTLTACSPQADKGCFSLMAPAAGSLWRDSLAAGVYHAVYTLAHQRQPVIGIRKSVQATHFAGRIDKSDPIAHGLDLSHPHSR